MTLRELSGRGLRSAWLLVVLEAVAVTVLERKTITSVWEVQWGLLGLAPIIIPLAGVSGAVGGILFWLSQGHRKTDRAYLAACVGLLAAGAAWSVGGGRHLASLSARSGFAALVASSAVLATYLSARWFARMIERRPAAVAFACAVLVLNLELANQRLLVRLYPGFHITLAVLSCLLAPFVGIPLASLGVKATHPRDQASKATLRKRARGTRFSQFRQQARWAWPWIVIASCVFLAPVGARSLSNFDNLRWLLADAAPILGQAVRVGAWIAPPPPISSSCLAANATIDCAKPTPSAGRTFSLVGRDLLLITIDAVRADHVGAYGYARTTTPRIDALANSGVRFEHAYAATAHTSYSVTSLMTGKYMRPLLLQGAGLDSDTWATLLQRYGIRTAAFYPPAVFFIDPSRFEAFQKTYLGFEYRKVEFLEGTARANQVRAYVAEQPLDQRLFLWVHLFAPHEPYEKQPGFDYGDRDVDRYDSEIAFADDASGRIVDAVRQLRPETVVIVSSDHGEEFGEHGGRYHGTTVYEEQVRVPLIVNAPGLFQPRVVSEPVQTVDLLPTVLAALDVPRPPRIRGRDLGGLLTGRQTPGPGLALAETEEQLLLAEGPFRLICSRMLGACKLYNIEADPKQQRDAGADFPEQADRLRRRERELAASHGQFEAEGLRAEGRGWPPAILRAVAGDADAADEIASLLDDADAAIRRKAAELLFELHRPSTRDALILALARDEDPAVKAWSALALTRLGHGAPLVVDLLSNTDLKWRRLAALALAESGDRRGGQILVDWWRDEKSRTYQRSRELLAALGRIRWRDAVYPLCKGLGDVRLRPAIASALADIGDEAARGPLVRAFAEERYQGARIALSESLTRLKAKEELARPLLRFMGVPDPLPGALGVALRSGILEHVGGPDQRDLRRLQQRSNLGVTLQLFIPKYGNNKGLRVLWRVSNPGPTAGEVRLGLPPIASP
ncbi:MAG TPA: sulfatase-like hydrolase/transferase, partial [Polyangiaceae bacterium]|nr:sulfatase-like hydrolase/transferase [Polyangiaceae bacterium]